MDELDSGLSRSIGSGAGTIDPSMGGASGLGGVGPQVCDAPEGE